MAENWMSLRAYARHREVALSAVQKAIESRRVTAIREEGGRITGIEQVQADAQWLANTDAAESMRNGKVVELVLAPPAGTTSTQAGAGEVSGDAPSSSSPGGGEQGNFLAARVKEAELRGQLLELDKLERIGELLERAVVQREFTEIFAQLKNAVFRIPDRKSQQLAGEADPVRVHRMLTDELRRVFDEFSNRLDESAAGVADDAAVAGERETVLS